VETGLIHAVLKLSFSKQYKDGWSQSFSFGGATGGASFETRGLSMVCVGLSERDLKNVVGALGGQAKFWGGQWPSLEPP